MSAAMCMCAVLREENESLKATIQKLLVEKAQSSSLLTANEKLLAENQRLKIEVGTFRLLISQMKELREREPSESSGDEGDAEGPSSKPVVDSAGVDNDVIWLDSDDEGGDEDDVQVLEESETSEIQMDAEESSVPQTSNVNVSQIANAADEEDDDPESIKLKVHHLADYIWNINCWWKCTKCPRTIRGERLARLLHIASHMNLLSSCPFEGCDVSSASPTHVSKTNKIMFKNLPEDEEKRLESDRLKHLIQLKEIEREFFPTKNISKMFKNAKNEECNKKCDAQRLTTHDNQAFHIAIHLQLRIECPVAECKKWCKYSNMAEHLRREHAQLSREEEEKWNEWRKVCRGS